MTVRLCDCVTVRLCDCCVSPGGDGHGPGPPEYLQLYGGALHTGDAQRHPPVVDLVVGVILQQSVGDLSQAQSLLRVHQEAHNPHTVDDNSPDLWRGTDEIIILLILSTTI